jgi:undecaprenyl-diphosphatase
MPSGEGALPLRHAVALGLLQGPAELLPVSSSAHTTLIPWLAGWPYAQLDGERRKAFEVALHAGAGLALALHMRRELLRDAAHLDRRRAGVIALALAPAVLAGYALGGPIERHLGGPRSIAAGLIAGAVAMALADARGATGPFRGATHPRVQVDASGGDGRGQEEAAARDGLALGLAQAGALIPGVSRNGATLTAARARGFGRGAAQALSWHAGLPVMLGASVLKGARMRATGVPREQRAALAVGGGAALLSTLASARLLDRRLREGQPLWPYALYRCLLAALVLARLRDAA